MTYFTCDCSTHFGWCWGGDDGVAKAGVQEFPAPRGSSPGYRWLMFRRWFTLQINIHRPDLVAYELPLPPKRQSSTAACEVAYGMATRVQEVCHELGVEFRPVANGIIKLLATGNGNAKKEAVIAAAAEMWPDYDPKKDPGGDEADSRWLNEYARRGFPLLEGATARKAREAKERREAKRR
jgi:hypothetical protein